MNELTIANEEMTMTSLEIANMTGKEHYNVVRDIRDMMSDLEEDFTLLKFEGREYNSKGQKRRVYLLDKRHALCLVGKYSAKARMAMIDKIEELEIEIKALKTHNSKMVAIDEVIEERQQKYRAIAAQHRIEGLYYAQSKVLDKILEAEGSGSQIDDLVANIRIENNRYYESQENVYSYQAQCEGLQMKLEVSKETITALTGKKHELLKLN